LVLSSGEFTVGSSYSVAVSTGAAIQVVSSTAVPG
jgi:hypothetical protein